MEIELSNKLGVVLCDLETCFTAHKLNSHDDQPQENFQSDVNNDIAIIEQSDHESECNLPTMNSKSVNGDERNLSWEKNLVVEVCDLMVCSRKNCDIPDCEKDKIREQIHELKKRKVDQQYFRSKKKQRYKEKNDDDASDIKEITNGKKVDESSDDHDSDIVEVSNDESDPNFKEETSEEEFSYEESDDSDWEEKNIPGKRRERMKKVKLEEKEKQKKLKEEEKQEKLEEKEKQKKLKEEKQRKKEKEKQTENLSSYELERQKHLDDKMAFLKSLMIDEIVDELEETAKSQTQRKPRVTKPKEILEVSRKSKRMENVKINLSEKALEAKVYDNATTSNEKPEIPSIYSFEDALHTEEKGSLYDYDKYFMDMEIKDETSNTNFPYDLDRFDPLVFTSYTYPFTLSSIAFHPAVDRTIILAGFVGGHISLWNTNTEPYFYTPHTESVTLIKVNPECPSQIFSSSLDGTIRQTDIESKSFVEAFKEDNILFKYFDFVSPNEFLIAQSDGCVSLIDNREKRFRSGFKRGFHCAAQWKCSSKAVRTVSSHPTKKDLCLTLDSDGLMKVWDRRFQKESVSQAATHGSVLSAFLSPVTGNSILCSSKISLRIYDSSHLEKMLRFKQKFDTNPVLNDIKVIPKRTKKLKLKTSPYVSQSTFFTRADWLPRSDSAFIVSNNVQKKTIIMESNDGKQISSLNNSGGILVFQEVHPVHNMLAVSFNAFNYKSKIHLYMKEICT